MSCQITALRESLVTPYLDDKYEEATWMSAKVRLLTSVCPQVSFEVEVKTKPLAAQLADVRLLPLKNIERPMNAYCVDKLMSLQF